MAIAYPDTTLECIACRSFHRRCDVREAGGDWFKDAGYCDCFGAVPELLRRRAEKARANELAASQALEAEFAASAEEARREAEELLASYRVTGEEQ